MFRSSQLRQLIAFAERPLFVSVHTSCTIAYILHFHYGITLALRGGGFRQVAHCPAALIPVCHNR